MYGNYQPQPFGNRPALGINWTNGLQEVNAMELPPGQMAVFIDKQNDGLMYIRSRDTYNVYNTRTFKFEEVQPQQPESPYVTRNELEQMFNKYLGGAKNEPLSATDTESATTSQSAGGKRKANG